MRRYVALPLLAAGTALALFGAWRLWGTPAHTEGTYATQPVTIGDIEETVTALGSLQPIEYVDVGAQVSGQLKKIYVAIGDEVKSGQLLAEIDPAVYEAKVRADEAQLLNLRAQVAEKKAQRTLAEQQFARQKTLLADRATSQDAYDTAEANLKVTDAQIKALEAQIKQTESTLNGDRANLSYTKIYAPMSGTVVSLVARQGQTLNANQTAPTILRIDQLGTMTVWTQVSEADVAKLRLGMSAYFTTLGRPGRRHYGTLRQILPTPEIVNNVVLYDALFDVANPDLDLLPQMSAQVFFVVNEAKNALLVPMAAVLGQADTGSRDGGYTVRVLENGKPAVRPVTLGVTNRLMAEVRSGLEAGELVVLEQPAQAAQTGSSVPRIARTPHL